MLDPAWQVLVVGGVPVGQEQQIHPEVIARFFHHPDTCSTATQSTTLFASRGDKTPWPGAATMDENQVARPRSALLGAAEPVDTGRFSFQDGASGPGDRRSTKKPAYLTPPNSPLTVVRELRRCRLAWRSPPTRSHGGSQGFKSPHLHPTTALVTGLAGYSRRAGNAQAHTFGQHLGSKSVDRSMFLNDLEVSCWRRGT